MTSFFADAAILIEGPAERMLVPHFIRNNFSKLDRCYVSLLEIGGSHAHRLRPLLENLGLLTLIITDLDSIAAESTGKVLPATQHGYRTGNDTLKSWVPEKILLDDVIGLPQTSKTSVDGKIHVAYPDQIKVGYKNQLHDVIPYTFEDALVLSNISLFENLADNKGLIKKLADAVGKATLDEAVDAMFSALDGGKKAEMALELLYLKEPEELCPPVYISEGLGWLASQITESTVELAIALNLSEEGQ